VSGFDGAILDFSVHGYFGAIHRACTGAAQMRRAALAALAFALKTGTL